MRNYGTVSTAKLMGARDLPPASPVRSYRLEEDIETRIAASLQELIRIGRPQDKEDRDRRRDALKQIIIECCKELGVGINARSNS